MKNTRYLTYVLGLYMTLAGSLAFAQERSERDKEQHQKEKTNKDSSIRIRTAQGEQDLEKYVENLGVDIERQISQLTRNLEVSFDEDNFSFNVNGDFDFEEFGENLSRSIEEMVSNMEIDLYDLSPADIKDSSFDDYRGSDLIRDIEKEHNARVEKIEHMKIRIREKKSIIDMKVRLDNGKVVEKHIEE
jgi:hypothetical protein